MVDARLPAEWLGSIRIDNLSDRAFRILAGALMWCNGQGTDGSVPARYTKYLHPDGEDSAAFDELEQAGIWNRTEEGFLLVGWSKELRQSTAAEVEHYREGARLRQKAYRDRRRVASVDPDSQPDSTPRAMRHVTRDATRDTTANVGSGSINEVPKERAYEVRNVTGNVTRDESSPFCARHPHGTSRPCGACARARTALEAHENRLTIRGWDCAVDGHKLVTDGTCAVCAFRPRKSVA